MSAVGAFILLWSIEALPVQPRRMKQESEVLVPGNRIGCCYRAVLLSSSDAPPRDMSIRDSTGAVQRTSKEKELPKEGDTKEKKQHPGQAVHLAPPSLPPGLEQPLRGSATLLPVPASRPPSIGIPNYIVKLNIGGVKYLTTSTTLLSRGACFMELFR